MNDENSGEQSSERTPDVLPHGVASLKKRPWAKRLLIIGLIAVIHYCSFYGLVVWPSAATANRGSLSDLLIVLASGTLGFPAIWIGIIFFRGQVSLHVFMVINGLIWGVAVYMLGKMLRSFRHQRRERIQRVPATEDSQDPADTNHRLESTRTKESIDSTNPFAPPTIAFHAELQNVQSRLQVVGWTIVLSSVFSLLFPILLLVAAMAESDSDSERIQMTVLGCLALLVHITALGGAVSILRTTHYRFAVVGSLALILPLFSPFFGLTIPIGVWALCLLRSLNAQQLFVRRE